MTKTDIRQEIRRRKAACSPGERAALSRDAAARLLEHPRWQTARTVLLYHALPDEVSTEALLFEARRQGKRVLLPVVVGDDLELREYRGAGAMAEGAFHIQEPVGEAVDDLSGLDLAVVPGVAFTRQGHRLGRGRGYYDRLLSRISEVYKIGLCWPFQLVDDLPAEPHDIPMDAVVY